MNTAIHPNFWLIGAKQRVTLRDLGGRPRVREPFVPPVIDPTIPFPPKGSSIKDIVAHAAAVCGVPVKDIKARKRSRHIVIARHMAAYELSGTGRLTLTQIGRVLGRDHSTIKHSLHVWPAKARELGIPCEPLQPARRGLGGRIMPIDAEASQGRHLRPVVGTGGEG